MLPGGHSPVVRDLGELVEPDSDQGEVPALFQGLLEEFGHSGPGGQPGGRVFVGDVGQPVDQMVFVHESDEPQDR